MAGIEEKNHILNKNNSILTLCGPETPKQVLWQTVKTQMKCCLSSISSRFALFADAKSIFREKNTFFVKF